MTAVLADLQENLARFYSDIGVPSVCFGPVGAGLHSDEEWVEIDSLVQLYQVLRRFVTE